MPLKTFSQHAYNYASDDLSEKSVSKSQQRLMGMALAYKRGELDNASDQVKQLAKSMSRKDLEDFAKTKHDNLPDEVSEKFDKSSAAHVLGKRMGFQTGFWKKKFNDDGTVTIIAHGWVPTRKSPIPLNHQKAITPLSTADSVYNWLNNSGYPSIKYNNSERTITKKQSADGKYGKFDFKFVKEKADNIHGHHYVLTIKSIGSKGIEEANARTKHDNLPDQVSEAVKSQKPGTIRLYHGTHKDNIPSFKKNGIKINVERGESARGNVFLSPRPDAAFAYAVMGGEYSYVATQGKRPTDVPDKDRVLFVFDIPEDWYNKHKTRVVKGSVPEVSFNVGIPAKFISGYIVGDRQKVYKMATTELEEANAKTLSIGQRKKAARKLRRYRRKVSLARKRKLKRTANVDTLKQRARRQVRTTLFKKFSRGKTKKDVSMARRGEIERRINRLAKRRVANMSLRQVRTARKIDRERRMGSK